MPGAEDRPDWSQCLRDDGDWVIVRAHTVLPHERIQDMQQAVAEVLDHLERYEAQLASLMTERFQLSPRIETVVVGIGAAA